MIRHGIAWRGLLLAAAGFAVAACSAPTWTKPHVTESQRVQDLTACQKQANASVETRYGAQIPIHSNDSPAGTSYDSQAMGGNQSFDTMMVRNEAIRTNQRMVADCMRSRGYSWGRLGSAK